MNWFKRHKKLSIVMAVLLVIGVIGAAISPAENTKTENPKREATQQQEPTNKTGTYEQYTYTIIENSGQKEKVATFQPFLARNDSVVVGAIKKVSIDAFGSDVIGETSPALEDRDGKSYIVFNTGSGKYYYLLVKEDDGQTHSISFFKD